MGRLGSRPERWPVEVRARPAPPSLAALTGGAPVAVGSPPAGHLEIRKIRGKNAEKRNFWGERGVRGIERGVRGGSCPERGHLPREVVGGTSSPCLYRLASSAPAPSDRTRSCGVDLTTTDAYARSHAPSHHAQGAAGATNSDTLYPDRRKALHSRGDAVGESTQISLTPIRRRESLDTERGSWR